MLARARPSGMGASWTARFLKRAESVVLATSERLQTELEQRLVAESRLGAIGSTVAQQLVFAIDLARSSFVPKEPKVTKKPVRDERQIELKWWESSSGTLRSPDITSAGQGHQQVAANLEAEHDEVPPRKKQTNQHRPGPLHRPDPQHRPDPEAQKFEGPQTDTRKNQTSKSKSKNGRSLRARRTAPSLTVIEYDMLTAKEVIAKAALMSEEERATFLAHEQAHKKRLSVVKALVSQTAP